jgi:hypothetical protein
MPASVRDAAGIWVSWIMLVRSLCNADVDQTDQQRPRVQASFVLLAIKVRPPELEDSSVVPPQEKAYGALDQIRHKYKSPEFWTKDVLWCKFLSIEI